MSFRCAVLLILTYQGLTRACQGGGGGGGGGYDEYNDEDENKTDADAAAKKKKIDASDRNALGAWGGFQVPDEMKAKWKSWLSDYKRNRKLEAQGNSSLYEQERGPDSGWPTNWHGIGGGYRGSPPDEPPPWAYKPFNIGLPAYCYEAPIKGTCNESLPSWAFNPYLDVCQEFTYSGCGGNRNNFKTQLKCTEQCMKTPSSGCDEQTDIKVDDYFIDENRRKLSRTCGYSYEDK